MGFVSLKAVQRKSSVHVMLAVHLLEILRSPMNFHFEDENRIVK
jgi:hypothetical protein